MKTFFVTLFLTSVFLLSSCVDSSPNFQQEITPITRSTVKETTATPVVVSAPWRVWSNASLGSRHLAVADALVKRGRLHEAIVSYKQAYDSAFTAEVRSEALLRQIGTLLKTGASQEVLNTTSSYLKAEGKKLSEADPRLAFIIAHAYIEKDNLNQSMAWFRLSGRGSTALQGKVKSAVSSYLQSLAPDRFEEGNQRWKFDPFLGKLFQAEKSRRAAGGLLAAPFSRTYFIARTYLPSPAEDLNAWQEQQETGWEGGKLVANEKIRIGLLLPLEGQYAVHAERIKNGVELALEEVGLDASKHLYVRDTKGIPSLAEREYANLINNVKPTVVLGPLLVKTTEVVSDRAKISGVPIISFAKRSGIPALGREVFRLGATSEDQVAELVDYSVRSLGIKTFAILYPNSQAGFEFANLFRERVGSRAELIFQESYQPGDKAAIEEKLERLALNPPEAIFIPDALENAFQLLSKLREKEEIKDPLTEEVIGYRDNFGKTSVLGTAYWDDPIAVRGYGQLLEGAVFVTPFFAKSARGDVTSFVASYEDRFNSSPDILSAQAYDATRLVLSSFSNESSDTRPVSRLLAIKEFPGVTGKLSVLGTGEISRRMSVIKFSRGEAREVMAGGINFAAAERSRLEDEEVWQ